MSADRLAGQRLVPRSLVGRGSVLGVEAMTLHPFSVAGGLRHLPASDGSTAFHSNLLVRGGANFAEETAPWSSGSMPAAPSAPRATGGAAGLLGS